MLSDRRGGFTVVEVLVALVILATGILIHRDADNDGALDLAPQLVVRLCRE